MSAFKHGGFPRPQFGSTQYYTDIKNNRLKHNEPDRARTTHSSQIELPDPEKKRATGNRRPSSWAASTTIHHKVSENERKNKIIREYLRRNGIGLEDNDLNKTLGEGSFSRVVRGSRRIRSGRGDGVSRPASVAVKIIDRKALATNMREKFLPRELEIIKCIQHPNIIKLHFILKFEQQQMDRIFIITDLADGGDLLDYIMEQGKLRESRSRRLFRDISKAVLHLHQRKISHRDLKGENILLKMNAKGKPERAYLTDFGFARRVESSRQKSSTFCGSTAYVSPEILENVPYEPMVSDCWSLGVILYIMLCAFMPYDTQNVRRMTQQQKQSVNFYHMADCLSPPVEQLIRSLMNPDVSRRLTAADIARSPWMEVRRKIPPKKSLNQTV